MSELGEGSTSELRSFVMADDPSLVFKEIHAEFSAAAVGYEEFLMNRYYQRSHKRQKFALSTIDEVMNAIGKDKPDELFEDEEKDKVAYWEKWRKLVDEKVGAGVQVNQTTVAEEDQLNSEGNETTIPGESEHQSLQSSLTNDLFEDAVTAHLIGTVMAINMVCPCGKTFEFLNKESDFFAAMNEEDTAAVFWSCKHPPKMGMDCCCGRGFVVNKVRENTISFTMV